MNRSNMFHIGLVFIVQYVALSETVLMEQLCQNFIKTRIPPTAFCEKYKNLT